MPGGNSSSSKRPHRMLKDGSMNSPDVKALSGAELLAKPSYQGLQLDESPPGGYEIDTDYGYSKYTGIAEFKGDTQGNDGWQKLATEAPNSAVGGRANYVKPQKGNPMAGKGGE